MSAPHIFLTSSGSKIPTATSSHSLNTKKASIPSVTTKENIRERLNIHVKKRIRCLDVVTQYPAASTHIPTSILSTTPLLSPLRSTHPFLVTGGSIAMKPMMVFGSSRIKISSDYSEGIEHSIPKTQIEQKSTKIKQQTKRIAKKKILVGNKKNKKVIDNIQQAENVNIKYLDEINEVFDRNEMNASSFNGSISPQSADASPVSYDKQDQKLGNTPDILSMVLSIKKNALMHDPYIEQFISSIR